MTEKQQPQPSNDQVVSEASSSKEKTSAKPSSAKTQKSSTSNTAATNKTPSSQPKQPLTIVTAVIALIVGLSTTGYTYYSHTQHTLETQQLTQQFQQALSQLNQRIEKQHQASETALSQVKQAYQTQLDQQAQSIQSLQQALGAFKDRRPDDWLLAESDYLIKLAQRKLFLEHDVRTAIQLMLSADQRLSAMNDASLTGLRQKIADDLVTLKALPIIDKTSLILRFNSLEQHIDTLPLSHMILPKEDHRQPREDVTNDIQDWRTNLWTSVKNFMSQFITFRTRDGRVLPLLSPEQDWYLRENIKTKLESAIHAVEAEQQPIYDVAINTAIKWIETYLNQGDHNVQDVLKQLKSLKETQVEVTYPATLKSPAAITELIHQRLRQAVTPMLKEDNS